MNKRTAMWGVCVLLAATLLAACGGGGGRGGGKGGTGGTAGAGGDGGTGGVGGDGGTGGVGGDGGTGGTGGVEPRAVEGRVVDMRGLPLGGAFVAINGDHQGSRVTAFDGSFTFSAVEPPYRLTVVHDGQSVDLHGLRTMEPVVTFGPTPTTIDEKLITGDILSPTFPLPAGERVLLASTSVPTFGQADETGWFELPVLWLGLGTKQQTDLQALHARMGGDCPEAYLATGRLSDLNMKGIDQLMVEITLDDDAPPTREVIFHWDLGRFTTHPISTLASIDVGGARFPLGCRPSENGGTLLVPATGAHFHVAGFDDLGALALRIVPANQDELVHVRLPSETSIRTVLPEEGATDVSVRPILRWTPIPGATLQVLRIDSTTRRAIFVLPGDVDRLELPDLGEMEFQLGAGQEHQWSVTAYLSPATPEDYLAGRFEIDLNYHFIGDELELFQTKAARFTTAP